jgi:hypothetical protein
MKVVLVIVFFIFFFNSCGKKEISETLKPTNYVQREVVLKNNLGVLEIYLPEELNNQYYTFYMCDISSDFRHLNCFTKSNYEIENDTVTDISRYFESSDSIYRLTIEQLWKPRYDTLYIGDYASILRNMKINNSYMFLKSEIIVSKILFVDGFTIPVFGYEVPDNKNVPIELIALILIKNQFVVLDFECMCSDCTDFIEKMYRSVKTIKVHDVNSDVLFNIQITRQNVYYERRYPGR